MISTGAFILAMAVVVMWCYAIYTADTKLRERPRRAIDHYQTAEHFDYTRRNPERARYHYQRALELAQTDPQDAPFIRERIADRMVPNPDYQFALDLQRIYDQTRPAPVVEHDRNVVRGQVWHTDTQNVHDTLLSDTVVEQFATLRRLGRAEPPPDMGEIISEVEAMRCPDAVKMLRYMQQHNAHIMKMGVGETQVVQEVWKRVKDTRTDPSARQSFCGALQDSWNGGAPHCVTGRTSRVLQSLAHMVPDAPDMGLLMTREAIRNEIFQNASKILDSRLEASGLRDSYNGSPNEEEQPQIDALQVEVRADIGKMVDGYAMLDAAAREKIKEECEAAL